MCFPFPHQDLHVPDISTSSTGEAVLGPSGVSRGVVEWEGGKGGSFDGVPERLGSDGTLTPIIDPGTSAVGRPGLSALGRLGSGCPGTGVTGPGPLSDSGDFMGTS